MTPDHPQGAWTCVLPFQPWAKKRPRISRGGGRTHQPKDDRDAEQRTRDCLVQAGPPLFVGPVCLRVTFYRASLQWVDTDNLTKHIKDCANGILWVDDVQVTDERCVKRLDRDNPRTEILVFPDYADNMSIDLSGRIAKDPH